MSQAPISNDRRAPVTVFWAEDLRLQDLFLEMDEDAAGMQGELLNDAGLSRLLAQT